MCGLVPALRVFELKMSTVRVILIPLGYLAKTMLKQLFRKNWYLTF